MSSSIENENPDIYEPVKIERDQQSIEAEQDEEVRDPIDRLEVFELIRNINDPEHPLTLEQLKCLTYDSVTVDDAKNTVDVQFTPTIPHCSLATLIGLCLRVKLIRSLPPRFKISIRVTPGTHASEDQVNRQLNDKERVCAALENSPLLDVVNKCLAEGPSTSHH